VSVIIACYRQARFLPATLECLFAQTHPSVEPIVINDGSDDDTEQVAKSFGDRIRYIHKANGGPASARNAGIKAARGEYLVILDADDLLHPGAIAAQLEAVAGHPRRIAVLGYRKFQTHPSQDGTDMLLEHVPFMPQLLYQNVAPPNAHLVRRQAVLDVGMFDEDRRVIGNEDWDLWLRLGLSGAEYHAVPQAYAYYRRHPGTLSTREIPMLESRTVVLLKAHRQILADPMLRQKWGVDLADAMRTFYRHCVVRGVGRRHTRQLWKALRELQRLGAAPSKSFARQMLDRFTGKLGERLTLTYFRLFEPATYAYYNNPEL
jgi:glycosyltransferase involved in cell wall biosynthesis